MYNSSDYISDEDCFFEHEYTPIEWLAFAKSDISKAETLAEPLREPYAEKLRAARSLLHEVQEFLYQN